MQPHDVLGLVDRQEVNYEVVVFLFSVKYVTASPTKNSNLLQQIPFTWTQTIIISTDMGIKRPHHDGSMPSESASPRTPNHPSKRRRSNDFAIPANKSASVNQLKSKIRDLTRALEHSDHLPAGVRIEKERALAGYKQDVEKIHEDKRKNELIKKYHMVRFFGGSLLALSKPRPLGEIVC